MTTTFPSPLLPHRRADMAVHALGLTTVLVGGGFLLNRSIGTLPDGLVMAVIVYVTCALASNLASNAYHFAPLHDRRTLLRRMDHSAIYLSISGTFTPFLVQAGTTWTLTVLVLCWGLTGLAIWNKITNPNVKSRWSTTSYLALGGLGLTAIPDLGDVPRETVWCILAGSAAYVTGTVFYTRKGMPFRFAIWHAWVVVGGACMFVGVWLALFSS